VPQERIRYTDKFDAPDFPGEIQTTMIYTRVLNRGGHGVTSPLDMCFFQWQPDDRYNCLYTGIADFISYDPQAFDSKSYQSQ
jgi:hypothetical protein